MAGLVKHGRVIKIFSYPEAPALWIFIFPLILIVIHKIYVRIFHGSVEKRRHVKTLYSASNT